MHEKDIHIDPFLRWRSYPTRLRGNRIVSNVVSVSPFVELLQAFSGWCTSPSMSSQFVRLMAQ